MSEKREFFSSRWGLLASSLGCAIGVGNIWRFPRLAAENGGGAFLLPWLIFLFAWSIPLIIAEYALGRKTRGGVVSTFATFGRKNRAWMGAFIAFVASSVLFYYSVIAGWCFYYFFESLGGAFVVMNPGEAETFFNAFTGAPEKTFLFMLLPLLICGGILFGGGVKGIERMNSIMIPLLFVLMIIAAVYACSLPGAMEGVKYLFIPRWEYLAKSETWIKALGQSAWSTGAGFGLFLTYAVYVKEEEDIVANSIFTAVGNNIASVIAALVVIPTVFAFMPEAKATAALQAGSVGLTFFTLPELFGQMPMGSVFAALFFLTLIFAALSSMISLVELPVRVVMDFGVRRRQAVIIVVAVAITLGLPSALSLDFLDNQDFVWGQGLIISGFLFAFLLIKYGAERFRHEFLNSRGGIHVGSWFEKVITWLIPLEFASLMLWWFVETINSEPNWWKLTVPKSLGTCLLQWGVAFAVFYMLNGFLKKKIALSEETANA